MYKLLIAFLWLPVLALSQQNKGIYIEINDNQYGCYITRQYVLQDSSLVINDYNEEGEIHETQENDKDLLNTTIAYLDTKREKEFIAKFPLDSLKADYNSGRSGCDSIRQMAITIRYNGITKTVGIQDCYSEKMARIFKFINSVIPKSKREELGISYAAKDFKCKQ